MSLPTCEHEPTVIRAVIEGRPSDLTTGALGGHVAACPVCREALAIATVLHEADGGEEVAVPTAAQMWWRLAVRARIEREQAAARPVVWVQGLAAASGVGLALSVAGQLRPVLADGAGTVVGRVVRAASEAVPTLGWPALDTLRMGAGMVALFGAALVLVAASTAVYLWVADE
jgi:hypothetical protein